MTRVVPKYLQYFNLVQHGKPYQTLELVAWDDSLAATEFEKKAKANLKSQASETSRCGGTLPLSKLSIH